MPGLSQHRHEVRASQLRRAVRRQAHEPQLGRTPDHWQVEAAEVARRQRVDAFQQPGGQRLALSLRRQRFDLVAVGGMRHQCPGGLSHQHRAGRGGLLQPRGDVDGVTHHQRFALGGAGGQHVTGVDADPGLDLAHGGNGVSHLEGCAHGPQSVVLVHGRDAEHRDQGVADHLLDRAAVTLHRLTDGGVEARHHIAQDLGVEPLAQLGRSDHVAEQHGDGLSHLAGGLALGGHGGAAGVAEARLFRVFNGASRASDHARESTLWRLREAFD